VDADGLGSESFAWHGGADPGGGRWYVWRLDNLVLFASEEDLEERVFVEAVNDAALRIRAART
jgi:hypothetical protein